MMVEKAVTEEDLRNVIRSMIGWRDGQKVTAKSLAAEWEVSQVFLSDVINGRRGISDNLARKLGYQRTVSFTKITKATFRKVSEK